MKFSAISLAAALALFSAVVHAAPLGDLVEYLPLYGRPPTPQFSGYLDATAGCDTDANGAYCKLHYWMAMAETDPLSKPTVLWLNGGPGSSSILGFLTEVGPLLINATGGLHDNPWSWTKVANVLALEAPIGVGYSYCANQKEKGQTCKNTDKYTASASRAALVDFFTTKFPELAGNEFFITGESYAGVYIPTLTKEILDHASDTIKMTGIAVGDPCTDNTAQRDSMDSLWYGYKYGLVDEQTYDLLWNTCKSRVPNLMTMGGKHLVAAHLNKKVKAKRQQLIEEQAAAATGTKIDEADVQSELQAYAEELLDDLQLGRRSASDDDDAYNKMDDDQFDKDKDECHVAHRKFLFSSSAGLSQGWSDLYIDDYSLFAPVSNQEDNDMGAYMMRSDVRKALHVEECPSKTWPFNEAVGFDYTKEYDACNEHIKDPRSMIDFYKHIVPRLKVAWVYNGDTDPCVSYEGTRSAVKRVGFAELDGGGYRPWFYNHTAASLQLLGEKAPLFGPGLLAQNMGAQMGGEVVNYENNFAFLTFHGSGHMVPQFRPQSALHMVDKLLQKQPLSPLLPSNSTLSKMTGKKFASVMETWTESAQAAPFVTEVAWVQDTANATISASSS